MGKILLELTDKEIEILKEGMKELIIFLKLSRSAYLEVHEDKNAKKADEQYQCAHNLLDKLNEIFDKHP